MSPLFVFAMLGATQLFLALMGWAVVFALTIRGRFRPYRGRLLGAVAGGSPGAFVGAIVGYLSAVGTAFGCVSLFSGEKCAAVVAVAASGLLLVGYSLGAFLGGKVGWRLGNDERPI